MKSKAIQENRNSKRARRGIAVVYVAIGLTVMLGMAALAVDISMLYTAQSELQRSADAAALAGDWGLLDERRLQGGCGEDEAFADAVASAQHLGTINSVLRSENVVTGDDVLLGYLDFEAGDTELDTSDPSAWNSVMVTVQRNADRGGSVMLNFARVFGLSSREMSASAVASFSDAVKGFRVTSSSGNAGLLPFALQVDVWLGLLEGTQTTGDHYAYDPETGSVSSGSDNVLELNLYPGAGTGQLPPGNFGTVDIGSSNNSTADIARQILFGITEEDLSYLGGSIELGDDGTLELNGDTGLSAGVKDELDAIMGQPRTIPLFSEVSGPGNNAMFTIVGFAGVRIVNVKLTGSMNSKQLIIQPAMSVDPSAIAGDGGTSWYVYQTPRLVR